MSLFKPNLTSILAGFNKTLVQLDTLILDNGDIAAANEKIIRDLDLVNKDLHAEIVSANKVAASIRKLIEA